jgi:serralysin
MKQDTTLHMESCDCALCAGNADKPYGSLTQGSAQLGVAGSGTAGDGLVGFNEARDALHTSGKTWTGSNGVGTTVTYTMALGDWQYSSANQGASSVGLMNAAQKAAVHSALGLWEGVANIHFTENNSLGNNTQMVFRQATLPSGIAGWASPWTSGSSISKADVLFDRAYTSNPTAGSHPYMTFIHEIGHALGLSHPGNYNGGTGSGGTTFYDNWDASVMSYYQGANANMAHGVPVTPMLYDIAAIQLLYGANTTTNAGNTVHTIDGSLKSYAIWDAGGTDTFSAASTSTTNTIDIREGLYNVSLVGNSAVWAAFNSNIENATGGSGVDTIYGNALANVLDGGSGNDVLTGGAGNDTLLGGIGNDEYRFSTSDGVDTITDSDHTGRIYINNAQLTGTSVNTGSGYSLGGYQLNTVGSNVEVSLGGASKLVLTNFASGDFGIVLSGVASGSGGAGSGAGAGSGSGSGSGSSFTCTAAIDKITGTESRDMIYALAGADIIYGNGGNDVIAGDEGNDKLYGGDGNDLISGGADNDTITGDAGDDSVYGDAGNDNITLGTGNDYVEGGDGNDKITGDDGNDTIKGGAGDDNLAGGEGVNSIEGGDGNDKVTAGSSADVITGGAGNDNISAGAGANTIDGGDGNDTIVSGSDADTIIGGNGADNIKAGDGNDTIDGGADNDVIDGGSGNDSIIGAAGNDKILGAAGADTLVGGDGDDNLAGGADNDSITGDLGNDILVGDAGNDILIGGIGDDTLKGGVGDDTLTGGIGADTFAFTGAGRDLVTDFVHGVDLLDITGNFAKILQGVTYDSAGAHITINATTIIDVAGVTHLELSDFV